MLLYAESDPRGIQVESHDRIQFSYWQPPFEQLLPGQSSDGSRRGVCVKHLAPAATANKLPSK